mgnify:CR=1 FL=1
MLTIAVFPNTNKPEAPAVLQRILSFYADKDVRVVMPVEEARFFQHAGYGVTDIENVPTDIALSIGGDGTLLGVCRRYSHHAVPVCGVNIGTLGFMADIELHELETRLQKLLDGDFHIEHRLLLAGSVRSGGKERFLGHAINDIVVKGGVARMLHLGLTINESHLLDCKADGIIISSPTGSTAYSLSAGGPIVNPNVRALIVTPICAHTFNIRPLIIQEDDTVHVAIASIPQDTTDRNRTSPVAFTGNKFEFRMPGSSQSIAGPVTVLNTIMAEELSQFYAVLKEAPDFNKALHDLVRKAFIEHGRIIFNGNGYEEAWVEEAARRGLVNLRSTADALPTYVLPKNVELMMKHGVYTKEEMLSRHEIHMEKYRKVIHIEAATMVDMVQHEILNAASEYESKLCETMLRKHEAAPELPCHVEKSLANSIGILNDKLLEQTVTLKTALETAPVGASGEEEMRYYHDVVAADMDAVRDTVDRLETLTAGKYWPYPTFYDLLFSV